MRIPNIKYLTISKLNELALLGFVFCMPIHKRVAIYFLFLFGLSFLFHSSSAVFKLRVQNNKVLLLLPFLYFIYVLQSLRDFSFSELGLKMSFVVFPLIFLASKCNWPILKEKIVKAHLFGCILSLLLCFSAATARYMDSHNTEMFFYTNLSIFMHAGYFAFHLTLAFASALYFLFFGQRGSKHYLLYILICVFLVFGVILLSSKGPLFALLFIFFMFLAHYSYVAKQWKNGIVATIVFVIILIAAYRTLDFFRYRVDSFLSALRDKPKETDTTSAREMVWERAIELIRAEPFVGYGNSANDKLYESYLQHNMQVEYKHRLNAHSEFLQLFLELGVLGVFALLLLLLNSIVDAVRKIDMLRLAFLVAIVIGFSTESMLETEAGILYFCFFYCFFTLSNTDVNA